MAELAPSLEEQAADLKKDLEGKGVAALHINLIAIGEALGLFEALRGTALTSKQLAEKADCNARYIKEWTLGMAAIKMLAYDEATDTFSLPPHVKLVVEDPVGLVWPAIATSLMGMYDKLVHAYKTGEGIPWSDQSPLLMTNTCRFFKPFYEGMLLSILPTEVKLKLSAGGRLADVGCGQGLTCQILGDAYPAAQIVGYDYHAPSIEVAKEEAAKRKLANVSFETAGADNFGTDSEPFDVVCFFDCFHDMAVASKAAQRAFQMLRPGGVVFLIELLAPDEDSVAAQLALPTSAVYPFFSCHVCLPCGMCGGGDALGTVVPTCIHRDIFTAAGFSSLLNVPSPANEAGFRTLLASKAE